jgi:hypothetical protein
MKSCGQVRLFAALFAALSLVTLVQPAGAATTLTAQWYTIQPDSDFGPIICCNVYANEVQPTLGPNGMPVLNPSYGGPPISDVDPVTHELTWWNPALNPKVTSTGTSVLTLPINQSMYPPNGTGGNDASGFQGAVLTGLLVVPTAETVQFDLGSDDDSFLAIGNNVVAQVGGVHSDSSTTYSTNLLAGTYLLTLFYVDRQETGASLEFAVDTSNVTLTATPLPAAFPLLAGGLGVMGMLGWRRKRKNATDLAGRLI